MGTENYGPNASLSRKAAVLPRNVCRIRPASYMYALLFGERRQYARATYFSFLIVI